MKFISTVLLYACVAFFYLIKLFSEVNFAKVILLVPIVKSFAGVITTLSWSSRNDPNNGRYERDLSVPWWFQDVVKRAFSKDLLITISVFILQWNPDSQTYFKNSNRKPYFRKNCSVPMSRTNRLFSQPRFQKSGFHYL